MADGWLQSIKQQIVKGNHEEARSRLVDYLRAEPDDADAWALLALLAREPAEQLQCYRQVLRIDPGNRQAATWVHSLSALASQSTGQRAASADHSASQRKVLEDPLEAALADLDLPDVQEAEGQSTPRSAPTARLPSHSAADRQSTPRELLDRLSTAQESEFGPDLPQEESAPGTAAAALAPEDILRLAGGPLPKEERRKCPACGAVVSRKETRCAWCSSPLPG